VQVVTLIKKIVNRNICVTRPNFHHMEGLYKIYLKGILTMSISMGALSAGYNFQNTLVGNKNLASYFTNMHKYGFVD